ncbi:MAG TPA: carboxypeptidase-like regulatory domain-containing protein [Terracidiphilus sp.]|nr:carboxypeptidase-like regulatory domain-containing protein [Terracidiphilus sp.]
MRTLALGFASLLLAPLTALACHPAAAPEPARPTLHGMVTDSTGAIIPNAEIDLVDTTGATDGTFQSGPDGSFEVVAPHAGAYTLVVSQAGFKTSSTPITVSAPAASAVASQAAVKLAPILRIVLSVAPAATNVVVSADSNQDLTATDDNRDASTMIAQDLKALPIFDNDFVSAMGSFLDSDVAATGGTGIMVDGVEANRVTVSPSAVQEVRINQDPYSARYYYPGRGQMEIVSKSAAQNFHGELNFYFRDSALNAKNALAPSKPFEQRRIYEGSATGPIPRAKKSSFLVSFNRAEEDLNSVVRATLVPTATNASGSFQANVPAPTRDTEFSLRAAHQFGAKHSAYLQYSFQNWTGQNQGVGGQTLAAAGYNNAFQEHDLVAHADSTLSDTTLNQLSLVAEHWTTRNTNVQEGPKISLQGDFIGGSAQADSLATEYNARLSEIVTWMHGRHMIKWGVDIPHLSRRVYDDHTNQLGSYTFAPTLAADGKTVIATALENYANNLPSGFSENTGDTRFIYHQQEMGSFIQDQFKINSRFAITPGLRYDWENLLADRRLGFAPRVSFAWVLDPQSKTILRGGGGFYYDRFGSGPLLDLARYADARRRSIILSLNPATLPQSGCVPISDCIALTAQPPALVQLEPHAKIPYQMHYGLSIERQLGERATGTVTVYGMRGIDMFRSVDINAPTLESGYSRRPNPAFGRIRQLQAAAFYTGSGFDISYRGMWNKHFTGFGRYTWSHYESNTGGINWFPQNQYDPEDEWANSGFDRRQRVGMYAIFQQKSLLNLAAGVFANAGSPWTELTGTDYYGDGLFNTRPDGVGRNTEIGPDYVDLDLRWGHDFAITGNKSDEAPRLGFSAASFNVLNHVNGSGIDTVETSPEFGQITSVAPPRRIQLAMRFQF